LNQPKENLVTNIVEKERKKEEKERSEREINRDKDLVTKLSNEVVLSPEVLNGDGWIRRSLALPLRDRWLFDYFRDRARLDGYSFNNLVRRALSEYYQRHPLPNPQSQIDRMLEVKMPLKPVTDCCVGNCRRKTRWVLRLQNRVGKVQEFVVCDSHKRWLHPDFKLLVSYRELR
jgi:hypothetical protein